LVRQRGLDVPIIVLVRRHRLEDIPVKVLDDVDGFIFLAEETPDFIARNLVSSLHQYADSLKTPFFGALVDYSEQGNMLWTCPGHNGGMFYSRSPIGRIFVEHLGQSVFRDDLDNSVLQLGDLLTHEGPAYSDLLTALFADGDAFRELWRQDGMALMEMRVGQPIPTSKVHFGYTDGISQTTIRGGPERYPPDHQKPCEPWLFVLLDEAENYFVPEPRELGLNGSFAVFKMAETDVVGFENFL
jgi:hypothetical protein